MVWSKDKIKAYYEANKDKITEKQKAYYEANKDKIKAYYEANKDKIAEQRKAYREANKKFSSLPVSIRREIIREGKRKQAINYIIKIQNKEEVIPPKDKSLGIMTEFL